jgi:DNA-binding Xre family transcriptional regulator
MNILKIKELAETRAGGLKKLAKDIQMSEANLHRCINANKIQAGDLEKIATIFKVPMGYFFDENISEFTSTKELFTEIERLKKIIAEKERAPVFLAIPLNAENEYIDLREMGGKVIKIVSK